MQRIFPTTLRSGVLRAVPYLRFASTSTVPIDEKSKVHGSYHWNFERGLSLVSVPLIATAFISANPIPLVDFALGFVMPLHCHIGFDACITDYIPARRAKFLNSLCTWLLRLTTALSIYGCYLLNTHDVGITQFMRNLWNGPEKEKEIKE